MMRIIFVFLLLLSVSLVSQTKGGSPFEDDNFSIDMGGNQGAQLFPTDKIPVGNEIDADYYIVGPGDVLSLYVNPQIAITTPVQVSPETTIMLPRHGELNIRNLTLNQVRDKIDSIFKSKNPRSEVSLSLVKPRSCLVHINGNVTFPSTYTVPSSYKVSSALLLANSTTGRMDIPFLQVPALLQFEEQQRDLDRIYNETGLPPRTSYSSRNITLLRNDGTSINVDFEKSVAMQNDSLDPYVREGDRIYVPFEKDDYAQISISGAVNRPAVLPFKRGDKASYLLKFGYGLSDDADLDKIYLIQPSINEKIKLELNEDGEIIGDDYDLYPGSAIIVDKYRAVKSSKQGVVSIEGEVRYPGIYLIESGVTKLTEVIEKAGGFTEEAYLPLANIYRRDDFEISKITRQRQYFEYLQYSNLTMQDTIRFNMDIELRKPYVSVDFVQLFENKDDFYDINIFDGDVIKVPGSPNKVYVYGQVVYPGYIEYVENKSMQWYIDRAGGYTSGADYKRSSIIRGKNKLWLDGRNEDITVYAGDDIYVPNPPDYPPSFYEQRYALYVGMLAALVNIINTVIFITDRNR